MLQRFLFRKATLVKKNTSQNHVSKSRNKLFQIGLYTLIIKKINKEDIIFFL